MWKSDCQQNNVFSKLIFLINQILKARYNVGSIDHIHMNHTKRNHEF